MEKTGSRTIVGTIANDLGSPVNGFYRFAPKYDLTKSEEVFGFMDRWEIPSSSINPIGIPFLHNSHNTLETVEPAEIDVIKNLDIYLVRAQLGNTKELLSELTGKYHLRISMSYKMAGSLVLPEAQDFSFSSHAAQFLIFSSGVEYNVAQD